MMSKWGRELIMGFYSLGRCHRYGVRGGHKSSVSMYVDVFVRYHDYRPYFQLIYFLHAMVNCPINCQHTASPVKESLEPWAEPKFPAVQDLAESPPEP